MKCPFCPHAVVKHSALRKRDLALALLLIFPYRCGHCRRRFHRFGFRSCPAVVARPSQNRQRELRAVADGSGNETMASDPEHAGLPALATGEIPLEPRQAWLSWPGRGEPARAKAAVPVADPFADPTADPSRSRERAAPERVSQPSAPGPDDGQELQQLLLGIARFAERVYPDHCKAEVIVYLPNGVNAVLPILGTARSSGANAPPEDSRAADGPTTRPNQP